MLLWFHSLVQLYWISYQFTFELKHVCLFQKLNYIWKVFRFFCSRLLSISFVSSRRNRFFYSSAILWVNLSRCIKVAIVNCIPMVTRYSLFLFADKWMIPYKIKSTTLKDTNFTKFWFHFSKFHQLEKNDHHIYRPFVCKCIWMIVKTCDIENDSGDYYHKIFPSILCIRSHNHWQ